MPNVLITAFDLFGGGLINPALEAVMLLPDEINGITVIKKEIPTVFGESVDVLYTALALAQPDAVICVGQAGGRPDITIERVAINVDDAHIPDNAGIERVDTPVVEGGPAAYFSTLPIKAIVNALRQAEIPASVSNSAGTFVCNHVMYAALHYAATRRVTMKAGFVHIPYTLRQVLDKPTKPSMSTENVVKGLKVVITTAVGDCLAQNK